MTTGTRSRFPTADERGQHHRRCSRSAHLPSGTTLCIGSPRRPATGHWVTRPSCGQVHSRCRSVLLPFARVCPIQPLPRHPLPLLSVDPWETSTLHLETSATSSKCTDLPPGHRSVARPQGWFDLCPDRRSAYPQVRWRKRRSAFSSIERSHPDDRRTSHPGSIPGSPHLRTLQSCPNSNSPAVAREGVAAHRLDPKSIRARSGARQRKLALHRARMRPTIGPPPRPGHSIGPQSGPLGEVVLDRQAAPPCLGPQQGTFQRAASAASAGATLNRYDCQVRRSSLMKHPSTGVCRLFAGVTNTPASRGVVRRCFT